MELATDRRIHLHDTGAGVTGHMGLVHASRADRRGEGINVPFPQSVPRCRNRGGPLG